MKTLTLDEAFAKASEGPFTVARDDAYQIPPLCIQAANGCANIAKMNPVMKGEEANAALLAHCFNHMRELRDALKQARELLSHSDVKFMICDGGRGHLGESSWYHRVDKAGREALQSANTVTMPE